MHKMLLHSLSELAEIKNQLIDSKPKVVKNTTSSNEFIYLFHINGEICKIVRFSGSYLDKHTKLSIKASSPMSAISKCKKEIKKRFPVKEFVIHLL